MQYRFLVILALTLTACFPDIDALRTPYDAGDSGDSDAAMDAGVDALVPSCSRTCLDLTFCNGVETCNPGHASADADGCVVGAPACDLSSSTCNETFNRCDCHNGDGDPAFKAPCGTDCADNDPNRYPGRTESCDATHDEDCDCTTVGELDADGDQFTSSACGNCIGEAGETHGPDCLDSGTNPQGVAAGNVYPGAPDPVGVGGDTDCDGIDG